MFTSRFHSVRDEQTQGNRGPELSTQPVQLYVSYLTADELVASVGRITDKLSTPGTGLSTRQRQQLLDIRQDLLRELGRRQLTLL